MADIFISYARDDAVRASELAREFNRLGWSTWYDAELATSEEYDERIEQELDIAKCAVVIWSRASVKSRWVRAEAGAADDQGKLIPVTLDEGVVPPIRFRLLNVVKLASTSLTPSMPQAISLVAEISAATGNAPAGWVGAQQDHGRAGGKSGAKTVTPGTWAITTKMLFGEVKYLIDLLPSGIATGTAKWGISRADITGRWHYDSSSQLLQLEVSGGVQKGIQSYAIHILNWIDDKSAQCTFAGRKSRLQKVS